MRASSFASVLPLLLPILGCGSESPPQPPAGVIPARELGTGDHTSTSVTFTEIANAASGLKSPRDLAFNPLRPDELWVVNNGDDSAVIIHDASTDERKAERRKDTNANHFMAFPAGIAFGEDATTFGVPGTFATCGESRNTYDGQAKGNDFTGPALWSSDLTIFAKKDPDGLGSHLDMLHNTPLCMGITHEKGNRYWVFNGFANSIDRYDFGKDHNVGQDDHSDGRSYQYATGSVKYVAGVPSHLFFDADEALLFVADTGNGRIASLDATTGSVGKALSPKEPMGTAVMMDGTALTDVVPSSAGLLEAPSGIELRNDLLYVSDNATSRISAFTRTGERVNYIETGLPKGSLAGINFGPDGKLYFVDIVGNRVLRIDTI